MKLIGKNKFGEQVYCDAAGTRTVKDDATILGSISSPTGFDPYNSTNHRYATVLELVESTCREHENDISGFGAVAAVREMAKYWSSHLAEGANVNILATDIGDVKERLDNILKDLASVLETKSAVTA